MFTVFGFYKFKRIKSLKKFRSLFQSELLDNKVRGTLILSPEGINGTLAGEKKSIFKIKNLLKKKLNFIKFDSNNCSLSKFQPFHRERVKIKKEVVPIGLKIDKKSKKQNRYLSGKSWNKLISNKETLVVDVRKPFEFKVGSFKKAINPDITHFRNFPKYLKKINKKKRVAMFCTGGIRCEKASVYLKQKGFKNIVQLKGGILNYLDKVEKKNSLWKGECFVFDNRVSVKHGLKQGSFSVCGGCRTPISSLDKKSNMYEKGVSCHNCYKNLTESQKTRFRMRQKQINNAKSKGIKHMFQKEYTV
tara:strand:- start:44 stop:955 length:912 start_codon:yes stop_codon:yes gene_type:complete